MDMLQKSVNPKFSLHVTPSFAGAREFPWINKPMGLAHWLENANVKEKVIVVIDPDQFFMDQLTPDGSRTVQGDNYPYGKGGLLCTAGCKHGEAFGRNVVGMNDIVKRGRPVAQTYGLGGHFVHSYNVTKIVGPTSPANHLAQGKAEQHYSVGPPMMVQVDDMRNIMKKWVEYMIPVFEQHPGDIQADMYAYSFAAANYRLDHMMFDQYMVSSPMIPGEGWPYVEQYLQGASCSDPNRNAQFPHAAIPTLLHIAHRYDSEVDDFMFHKGHVPANIFTCELPMLVMPPDDLIQKSQGLENKQKMYMLCNAYNLIREAVTAWKRKFCAPDKANYEEKIMLQKHHQTCKKEENGKTCWNFARVVR